MIRVDEIENQLWVSEVEQQPGHTYIKHYPVEFLLMENLIGYAGCDAIIEVAEEEWLMPLTHPEKCVLDMDTMISMFFGNE